MFVSWNVHDRYTMNTAMEPPITPDSTSQEPELSQRPRRARRTPWGLFIGLLLILAIIVAGAYYTLTERLAPQGVSIRAGLSIGDYPSS